MASGFRIQFGNFFGYNLETRVYGWSPDTGKRGSQIGYDYELALDGVDTPYGLGGSLDFLNIGGIGGKATASLFGVGVESPAKWPWSLPGWNFLPNRGSQAIDGTERLSFALDQAQLGRLNPAAGEQGIATATFSLTGVSGRGQVVAYLYNDGVQVGQEIFALTRAGNITIQSNGRVFDEVRLGSYSGNVSFYVGKATFDTADKAPAVPPTLSIAADEASKAEGDSGTTAFTFTVTRMGDTSVATSAAWAVSSAVADAADFVGGALPSGTVSFAAGQTTATITVEVSGDKVFEVDEAFTVTLSSPTGGAVIDSIKASASSTITNDDRPDPPILSVWVAHAEKITDSDGNEKAQYTFVVTRTGNTGVIENVPFSAVLPEGFNVTEPTGGFVSFGADDERKTITIIGPASLSAEYVEYVDISITLDNPEDDSYVLQQHEKSAVARTTDDWEQLAGVDPELLGTFVGYKTLSGLSGIDTITISTTGGTASDDGDTTVSAAASASVNANSVYGGDGDDVVGISAVGGTASATNHATASGAAYAFGSADIYANYIYGGDGSDAITISATGGTANAYAPSYVRAYGSADIYNNYVFGGDGNDTIGIFATGGTASGSSGDVNANVNIGFSHVHGGDGDDTITISATAGTVSTSGYARATISNNRVYGGDGNDTITISATGGTVNADGDVSTYAVGNHVFAGNGNDTITISAVTTNGAAFTYSNTVHGGTGSDTFSFAGVALYINDETYANVIGDFNAGEGDKIRLTDAGSVANFEAGGAYDSYADALTAANTAVTGTIRYFFASVGSDGYLFYDVNGDAGADQAVKLTGVAAFEAGSIEGV